MREHSNSFKLQAARALLQLMVNCAGSRVLLHANRNSVRLCSHPNMLPACTHARRRLFCSQHNPLYNFTRRRQPSS